MSILRNIRSKIWACVSVALLSYLIATLVTAWVNNDIKTSNIKIQQVDLPFAYKAILVHTLFHAQSEEYAEALHHKSKGDVLSANTRNEQIAPLLNELVARGGSDDLSKRIHSLRDRYNAYFSSASNYYMQAIQKRASSGVDKEIKHLEKVHGELDKEFAQISELFQTKIFSDLEDNNQNIDFYTRLLHILFIVFLLLTTLVINWLANKEIIAPLGNIKKMIKGFSRGRTVEKPVGRPDGDEIQELAYSFWQMTRELQHITVSRDYVDNIINNMTDSLIILDPDLSIQTVNHATLALLNIPEEELEGRSFRDVLSHGEESFVESVFAGLIAGKPVTNIEALYIDGRGRAIPVLYSASALYLPDGTMQGISCLAHDISEIKEQRDQLEFLANFDKLTGLPNRNLFFDRLTLTMNESRRYGHLFALLYLDLDHFKPLNDTHGHEAGDIALQEVARRIQETVRDTDTVSRVGGDEFTVLLSRVHNASDAMKVACKILDAIGQPYYINGNQCELGVSIGICLSSSEFVNADTLMKNADTAMYSAKAQGRNRFMFSSPDQV